MHMFSSLEMIFEHFAQLSMIHDEIYCLMSLLGALKIPALELLDIIDYNFIFDILDEADLTTLTYVIQH